MRLLIQRVTRASVTIAGELHAQIGPGLVVLAGISTEDGADEIAYLTGKLVQLRIFDDEQGVMNLNIQQVDGEILLVSQFTLMASTKKGNRPSYIHAAPEVQSRPLYEQLCIRVSDALGKPIAKGVFGADMQVELVNDGPVTIWIDSRQKE